ncbi:MAG: hypothetical protein AAF716_15145 [Cyanobacteria bacterium P01_D01_bin.1]
MIACLENKTSEIDNQIASTQQQLELLIRQVQAMANSQNNNPNFLAPAERNIQGIYEILQANAREQAERSKLIDQQIQALIDERRRS